MQLVIKYKICLLISRYEFDVYRNEIVSTQLPLFDFKDDAESWIEVSGEKNTDYMIIEVYRRA